MRYCFTFLILLCTLSGIAQDIDFTNLNIGDGLSQNSVLSIVQDKQGFMWFGTRNGVNKYDSHKFKVYRTGSEEDNYVTALLSDRQGRLWAGTRNGLKIFDTAKDSFVNVPLSYRYTSDVSNKNINGLYEDRQGRLWVSTEFCVNVIQFNGPHKNIKVIPVTSGKVVIRCVFEDDDGVIWVGTSSGIVRLFLKNGQYKLQPLRHNPDEPNSLSNDQVMDITEDRYHNVWVATIPGGLNRFNRQTGQFTHYLHSNQEQHSLVNNNIRKLIPDNKGNLWIGTQDGVSVFNILDGKFTNYVNTPWDRNSLSQNSIHSLYKDHTGTIWIGTFFGGVNSYFSYNTPFKNYSNRSFDHRLNNNVISSIIEDDDLNLWIGTEGGGVNFLNRKTGKFTFYTNNLNDPASLGSNLVKLIFKDRDHNIWIGTHGGGLNLFDKKHKIFKKLLYAEHETYGSEITAMVEDKQGRYWIGTETQGLRLFQKDGENLNPVACPHIDKIIGNNHIFSIIETATNDIWVGGSKGLYLIRHGQYDQDPVHIYSKSAVNCLHQDEEGSIWAGTNDDGLLQFTAAGQLQKSFGDGSGLPSNKILGILQDNDRILWISTGNGLSRFDVKNNVINIYTEADGIVSNVYNNNSYFKSSTGEMFFGGFEGLTSFDPKLIQLNHVVPPIYINTVVANSPVKKLFPIENKSVSEKSITLNYDQNIFSIDISLLNYIKSQKNIYKSILKNYDKTWTVSPNPVVNYTNVPPGKYKFVVSGANNDNIWSKDAVLNITILPPFWKTWWAYTIYIVLAAGLIFFVIRHVFLKALYNKYREITQLKLNFFTNISHEIRTHLTLIIAPVEKLISKENQDPYDQQQLVTVKNNSESLLQLVNELMDFRKAETGHLPLHVSNYNIVPFIQSIFSSFYEVSVSKNIQTDFNCPAEHLDVYFDKEQLEKVFYNLLSNAFKFTPDGGTVSVNVEEDITEIKLSVHNSGKGISKQNIKWLFDNYFQENDYGNHDTGYGIGLALSKSIVELHYGLLTVKSEPINNDNEFSKNTCFTVTLLKGREHFGHEQVTEKLISQPDIQQVSEVGIDIGTLPPLQLSNSNQTILIVEDNDAIRAFLDNNLRENYNIIEAHNGKKGWEIAQDQIPDLIISDVMMPEMDGLQLTNLLKNDERTSHIPLILLTAKNTVHNHVNGLQSGADIYLTKPFNLEVLNLQIRNLLKSRELLWAQFTRQLLQDESHLQKEPAPLVKMHPLDEAFMDKIIKLVQENLDVSDFGVAMLSKKVFMSQPILNKKIRAITGLSANDFVKTLRLKKAAELLREKRYTVYEISYMVGYENSKYFSREFRKQYDKTPSEYATIPITLQAL